MTTSGINIDVAAKILLSPESIKLDKREKFIKDVEKTFAEVLKTTELKSVLTLDPKIKSLDLTQLKGDLVRARDLMTEFSKAISTSAFDDNKQPRSILKTLQTAAKEFPAIQEEFKSFYKALEKEIKEGGALTVKDLEAITARLATAFGQMAKLGNVAPEGFAETKKQISELMAAVASGSKEALQPMNKLDESIVHLAASSKQLSAISRTFESMGGKYGSAGVTTFLDAQIKSLKETEQEWAKAQKALNSYREATIALNGIAGASGDKKLPLYTEQLAAIRDMQALLDKSVVTERVRYQQLQLQYDYINKEKQAVIESLSASEKVLQLEKEIREVEKDRANITVNKSNLRAEIQDRQLILSSLREEIKLQAELAKNAANGQISAHASAVIDTLRQEKLLQEELIRTAGERIRQASQLEKKEQELLLVIESRNRAEAAVKSNATLEEKYAALQKIIRSYQDEIRIIESKGLIEKKLAADIASEVSTAQRHIDLANKELEIISRSITERDKVLKIEADINKVISDRSKLSVNSSSLRAEIQDRQLVLSSLKEEIRLQLELEKVSTNNQSKSNAAAKIDALRQEKLLQEELIRTAGEKIRQTDLLVRKEQDLALIVEKRANAENAFKSTTSIKEQYEALQQVIRSYQDEIRVIESKGLLEKKSAVAIAAEVEAIQKAISARTTYAETLSKQLTQQERIQSLNNAITEQQNLATNSNKQKLIQLTNMEQLTSQLLKSYVNIGATESANQKIALDSLSVIKQELEVLRQKIKEEEALLAIRRQIRDTAIPAVSSAKSGYQTANQNVSNLTPTSSTSDSAKAYEAAALAAKNYAVALNSLSEKLASLNKISSSQKFKQEADEMQKAADSAKQLASKYTELTSIEQKLTDVAARRQELQSRPIENRAQVDSIIATLREELRLIEARTKAELELARAQLASDPAARDAKLRQLNATYAQQDQAIRANIRALQDEAKTTLETIHVTEQLQRTVAAFFRYAIGYQAGYMVLNAFQDLAKEAVVLEDKLVTIQAIARTTDGELSKVASSIKLLASNSRVAVTELADAAQILAQAGVEVKNLGSALESVLEVSEATGASLKVAADLVTTFSNAFKLVDTKAISDLVTNAANLSKLAPEDLQTIMSLGGSAAAQYGVQPQDYLSAVEVLRNVGIKQSTVATGLRQLMQELFVPDEKTLTFLKQRYAELGITMADDVTGGVQRAMTEGDIINRFQSFLQTNNPLAMALQEYRKLGFGDSIASEVTRLFDIRATNVFQPLINNMDKLAMYATQTLAAGTAAEGASKRMETLAGQWGEFSNKMALLADSMTSRGIPALTSFLAKFNDIIDRLMSDADKIQASTGKTAGDTVIGMTGLTASAGIAAGLGGASLLGGLSGLLKGGGVKGGIVAAISVALLEGIAASVISSIAPAEKREFWSEAFSDLVSSANVALIATSLAPGAAKVVVGVVSFLVTAIFELLNDSEVDLKSKMEAQIKLEEKSAIELEKTQKAIDSFSNTAAVGFGKMLKDISDMADTSSAYIAKAFNSDKINKAVQGLSDPSSNKLGEELREALITLVSSATEVGSKAYNETLDKIKELAKKIDSGVSKNLDNQTLESLRSAGLALQDEAGALTGAMNEFFKKLTFITSELSKGKQLSVEDAALWKAYQDYASGVKGLVDDGGFLKGYITDQNKALDFLRKLVEDAKKNAEAGAAKIQETTAASFKTSLELVDKAIEDSVKKKLISKFGSISKAILSGTQADVDEAKAEAIKEEMLKLRVILTDLVAKGDIDAIRKYYEAAKAKLEQAKVTGEKLPESQAEFDLLEKSFQEVKEKVKAGLIASLKKLRDSINMDVVALDTYIKKLPEGDPEVAKAQEARKERIQKSAYLSGEINKLEQQNLDQTMKYVGDSDAKQKEYLKAQSEGTTNAKEVVQRANAYAKQHQDEIEASGKAYERAAGELAAAKVGQAEVEKQIAELMQQGTPAAYKKVLDLLQDQGAVLQKANAQISKAFESLVAQLDPKDRKGFMEWLGKKPTNANEIEAALAKISAELVKADGSPFIKGLFDQDVTTKLQQLASSVEARVDQQKRIKDKEDEVIDKLLNSTAQLGKVRENASQEERDAATTIYEAELKLAKATGDTTELRYSIFKEEQEAQKQMGIANDKSKSLNERRIASVEALKILKDVLEKQLDDFNQKGKGPLQASQTDIQYTIDKIKQIQKSMEDINISREAQNKQISDIASGAANFSSVAAAMHTKVAASIDAFNAAIANLKNNNAAASISEISRAFDGVSASIKATGDNLRNALTADQFAVVDKAISSTTSQIAALKKETTDKVRILLESGQVEEARKVLLEASAKLTSLQKQAEDKIGIKADTSGIKSAADDLGSVEEKFNNLKDSSKSFSDSVANDLKLLETTIAGLNSGNAWKALQDFDKAFKDAEKSIDSVMSSMQGSMSEKAFAPIKDALESVKIKIGDLRESTREEIKAKISAGDIEGAKKLLTDAKSSLQDLLKTAEKPVKISADTGGLDETGKKLEQIKKGIAELQTFVDTNKVFQGLRDSADANTRQAALLIDDFVTFFFSRANELSKIVLEAKTDAETKEAQKKLNEFAAEVLQKSKEIKESPVVVAAEDKNVVSTLSTLTTSFLETVNTWRDKPLPVSADADENSAKQASSDVERIVASTDAIKVVELDTTAAERQSQELDSKLATTITKTIEVKTVQSAANGGLIQAYATGGKVEPSNRVDYISGGNVSGPGTGTSDSIPAWLSHGEFVIPAKSVEKYGAAIFEAYRNGTAKYAEGGLVQRFAEGGGVKSKTDSAGADLGADWGGSGTAGAGTPVGPYSSTPSGNSGVNYTRVSGKTNADVQAESDAAMAEHQKRVEESKKDGQAVAAGAAAAAKAYQEAIAKLKQEITDEKNAIRKEMADKIRAINDEREKQTSALRAQMSELQKKGISYNAPATPHTDADAAPKYSLNSRYTNEEAVKADIKKVEAGFEQWKAKIEDERKKREEEIQRKTQEAIAAAERKAQYRLAELQDYANKQLAAIAQSKAQQDANIKDNLVKTVINVFRHWQPVGTRGAGYTAFDGAERSYVNKNKKEDGAEAEARYVAIQAENQRRIDGTNAYQIQHINQTVASKTAEINRDLESAKKSDAFDKWKKQEDDIWSKVLTSQTLKKDALLGRLNAKADELAKAKAAADSAASKKLDASITSAKNATDAFLGSNDRFSYKSITSQFKFAEGGKVSGPGTGTSDSIPAWLSNGEFVIPASKVEKYGVDTFESFRKGTAQKYAVGGEVGNSYARGGVAVAMSSSAPSTSAASSSTPDTSAEDAKKAAEEARKARVEAEKSSVDSAISSMHEDEANKFKALKEELEKLRDDLKYKKREAEKAANDKYAEKIKDLEIKIAEYETEDPSSKGKYQGLPKGMLDATDKEALAKQYEDRVAAIKEEFEERIKLIELQLKKTIAELEEKYERKLRDLIKKKLSSELSVRLYGLAPKEEIAVYKDEFERRYKGSDIVGYNIIPPPGLVGKESNPFPSIYRPAKLITLGNTDYQASTYIFDSKTVGGTPEVIDKALSPVDTKYSDGVAELDKSLAIDIKQAENNFNRSVVELEKSMEEMLGIEEARKVFLESEFSQTSDSAYSSASKVRSESNGSENNGSGESSNNQYKGSANGYATGGLVSHAMPPQSIGAAELAYGGSVSDLATLNSEIASTTADAEIVDKAKEAAYSEAASDLMEKLKSVKELKQRELDGLSPNLSEAEVKRQTAEIGIKWDSIIEELSSKLGIKAKEVDGKFSEPTNFYANKLAQLNKLKEGEVVKLAEGGSTESYNPSRIDQEIAKTKDTLDGINKKRDDLFSKVAGRWLQALEVVKGRRDAQLSSIDPSKPVPIQKAMYQAIVSKWQPAIDELEKRVKDARDAVDNLFAPDVSHFEEKLRWLESMRTNSAATAPSEATSSTPFNTKATAPVQNVGAEPVQNVGAEPVQDTPEVPYPTKPSYSFPAPNAHMNSLAYVIDNVNKKFDEWVNGIPNGYRNDPIWKAIIDEQTRIKDQAMNGADPGAINRLVDFTLPEVPWTGPDEAFPGALAAPMADGGKVAGQGSPTSDSIPAWLSNGEFVIPAHAVKKYGADTFEAYRKGIIPKLAEGGLLDKLNILKPPTMAVGGLVAHSSTHASTGPSSIVNLQIGNKTFETKANYDVVENLRSHVRLQRIKEGK